MQDIAAAAGVHVQTIYLAYGTKAELLRAAASRKVKASARPVAQRSSDPRRKLIRPDQRDRGPCGHGRTRWPVAKTVRHVDRERRRDAQTHNGGTGTFRRAESSITIELA